MIRFLAIVSVLSVFLVAAFGEKAFSQTTEGFLVEDAWAPPSLDGASVAVAFATLANPTDADIEITAMASPATQTVELHDHVMQDGRMSMRRVEKMVVPAHGALTMKPGGLHLMLIGLNGTLVDGETLSVTFTPKEGAAKTISFPISQARLIASLKSRTDSAHEH